MNNINFLIDLISPYALSVDHNIHQLEYSSKGIFKKRKEDAEMFIGGRFAGLKAEATDDIQAFIHDKDSEVNGELQVCTVLDCYLSTTDAVKISETVMRHMNDPNPNRGKAKFQYFYDDNEKKGRYVIWENPGFVGAVLSAVGASVKK